MRAAEADDLPVAVVGQPQVQQLTVDLRVELQRQGAAEHKRLGRIRRARNLFRARRQRPPIEMPLEPRPVGYHGGIVAFDVVPPDLRVRRPRHRSAERLRQQLTAEAHAEQGHARIRGVAHQSHLGVHPGAPQRFVVDGPARSQRNDDVIGGRIGKGDVDCGVVDALRGHDLEHLDIEPLFSEGFAEKGRCREVFVVQKQDFRRHDSHYFGGRTGGASSGASSAPILRNRVSAAFS